MKKEIFARIITIGFVLLAIAIPLGGYWLTNRQDRIELHARMPENGGWSIDTLQAKVGQPITLHITSDDVVHGFGIGKSDQASLEIIPGVFTDTRIIFDRPGKYTFYCTRWCGQNHWRMRGTIEVTGSGVPVDIDPQPLFVKLGLDIDNPPMADVTPARISSPERGEQFSYLLPENTLDRNVYLSNSPAKLWLQLRAESSLSSLNDDDIWDVVAWVWQKQSTPEALAEGNEIYKANCAACHGESGKGDGVMVRGLPVWSMESHTAGGDMTNSATGEGLFSPPDLTDPKHLLGASPALLEGKILRGGMGTGMPYWGPIFTPKQVDAVVAYLYTFAWKPPSEGR